MVLSFVLPVLLTLTPRQWQSTVPWDSSRCLKCDQSGDCFGNKPMTCSAWSGGADSERRCCPLPGGLFSTEWCSPSGESCYEPVLGIFGLVLVVLLVAFCWSCLFYCCGTFHTT